VIREALARGADRAIHVEDDGLASADAFVTSAALAAAMQEEKFDLTLTGLQSDDQGFAQVGVILAEKLGLPHATIIMEVQAEGGALRVKRELEGGWFQWVAMPLPAVLTIQSGINQLRYATLKGIMAAKKKEIRKATVPAGLAGKQKIASLYVPEKGKKTQLIAGSPAEAARELVRKLRERVEGLVMRTTFITGFPGETDADFADGWQGVALALNDLGRHAEAIDAATAHSP
jgi:electron transfer flavoprotein beta subunit